MATSKPKKRTGASLKGVGKRATQSDLSPKKNPRGGADATKLPNLSGAQAIQATPIPLNKILGPGGLLIP